MKPDRYLFKCGCKRSDYYNPPGSNSKQCPEHHVGMSPIKIRLCSICGEEYECSVKACQPKPICDNCRPADTVRVQTLYRAKKRKPGTKVRKYERWKPAIKKKTVKVKKIVLEPQSQTLDERFERIIDKKFPPIVMPKWSKEFSEAFLGGVK